MDARWPVFLFAPAALTVPAAHATVYLTVEQAQQLLFAGAGFTAVDPGRRERIWRVSAGGWFIVDQVLGKHELISYALGIDGSGRVRGVEILEYRESHGGEVRDAAWRAQFAGKSAADSLQLDRDIRNISGATLSCRHVTDGVKRLLKLYESELRQR
ncbi:MAG TPA: FMN-binding protein [Burkholderiales bacterium]|nr:FMN-binding protein [Burkholderiales bacterium]